MLWHLQYSNKTSSFLYILTFTMLKILLPYILYPPHTYCTFTSWSMWSRGCPSTSPDLLPQLKNKSRLAEVSSDYQSVPPPYKSKQVGQEEHSHLQCLWWVSPDILCIFQKALHWTDDWAHYWTDQPLLSSTDWGICQCHNFWNWRLYVFSMVLIMLIIIQSHTCMHTWMCMNTNICGHLLIWVFLWLMVTFRNLVSDIWCWFFWANVGRILGEEKKKNEEMKENDRALHKVLSGPAISKPTSSFNHRLLQDPSHPKTWQQRQMILAPILH